MEGRREGGNEGKREGAKEWMRCLCVREREKNWAVFGCEGEREGKSGWGGCTLYVGG